MTPLVSQLWPQFMADPDFAASFGRVIVEHARMLRQERQVVFTLRSAAPLDKGLCARLLASLQPDYEGFELRIQNLRKGQRDHLLEALMGVKEYDLRPAAAQPPISVLDCTCGFGADAAVASFGLPAGSRVDALEVSPLLEAVTAWGFSHFVHKKDDVTAALRRISLRCGDYRDYLLSDEGPVYDVLYFDPMFQRPVEASCQFQPVRAIMEHGGLTRDLIERALQKARRRVVIKERDFRQLCRDFPDVTLYGGKYSRIGYAVLECDSWKK